MAELVKDVARCAEGLARAITRHMAREEAEVRYMVWCVSGRRGEGMQGMSSMLGDGGCACDCWGVLGELPRAPALPVCVP